MADDGMLLNFAPVSNEPWQPKTTFKGGHWKDRLTAKKSAAYGQAKRAEAKRGPIQTTTPPSTDEAESHVRDFPSPRPAKRQRVGEDTDFRPSTRPQQVPTGQAKSEAPRRQGPPKQVISSLFTYNPSSKVERPEKAQDDEVIEPSNAPLSSELDTFTSLGLSRSLAAHLLNKMHIKAPTAIQSKAVTQLVKDDSDAFIQAETGSGKTLAYLLPIVQRLIQISEDMRQHKSEGEGAGLSRHSGLFAIILAPTRELSKQISTVLEALLGCAHWIVAGTVIGGEKKKSEKARLRKGLNVLVATPGRLADHLNNTEVLDVSNVRWLVLDEGDRLMELGFEQDIQKIVSVLNLRMRKTRKEEMPWLPEKRTTVLCSATMKMDVQKLGEISLKDAAHIAAEKSQEELAGDKGFSAPAQLKQSYAVVPGKLRLVTLVAILRRAFARRGSVMKTIVFLSCADSVDFHFELLTRADKAGKDEKVEEDDSKKTSPVASKNPHDRKIRQGNTIDESRTSGLGTAFSAKDNPVKLFRLHGSLPQAIRTSTLQAFTDSKDPAVLICTDVASRGLDLPNVDFVIEYDPPFSKDDHLHRIGRTARAGRDGRALIFLQPGGEEGYVNILQDGRRDTGRGLTRHDADELLKKGFSASVGVVNNREWEDRATEYQLDVERWALANPKHLEQARRAFQSHIRAYATHVASERGIFDLKTLHLGHLAKAFALRDRPGSINVPGLRPGKDSGAKNKEARRSKAVGEARSSATGSKRSAEDSVHDSEAHDAARKMRAKMKAMGGASEFNLG